MPGPGSIAALYAARAAQVVGEPQISWQDPWDDPPTELLRDDLLWWRPDPNGDYSVSKWVRNMALSPKRDSFFIGCSKCDVTWLAPTDIERRPQCFNCGKFVRGTPAFEDRLRELRMEEHA